jgi:hypothetical protein
MANTPDENSVLLRDRRLTLAITDVPPVRHLST